MIVEDDRSLDYLIPGCSRDDKVKLKDSEVIRKVRVWAETNNPKDMGSWFCLWTSTQESVLEVFDMIEP